MQALYETQLKTIAKLVEINNSFVGDRERVDFKRYGEAIALNMSSVHQNTALSEQEVDLITIGFMVLVLARATAQGTTLTPYLTLPNCSLSSPSLKEIENHVHTWLPQALKEPRFLRYNYYDGLYYALQIGFYLLNKKYSLDLDAFATNCRTVFSSMEEAELVALESKVRSSMQSSEFVPLQTISDEYKKHTVDVNNFMTQARTQFCNILPETFEDEYTRYSVYYNRKNLQKNIALMGTDYYQLETDLSVNPRQDRPVHSKNLTYLMQYSEMHAIELFEEAVAICADSNKEALRAAITTLWHHSLNTRHFPAVALENVVKAVCH